MIAELTLAECSKIHVALLGILVDDRDDLDAAERASREALAELLAQNCNHPRLGEIITAADAARAEIAFQTGGDRTPIQFDVQSLKEATGLSTPEVELVARLCGASKKRRGSKEFWQNTDAVVGAFKFPDDLIEW